MIGTHKGYRLVSADFSSKGLQIHAGACCADEALPGQANCVAGGGKNSEDDELRNVWPVILPQGWQVATPNISVAQIILPRRHVWSPSAPPGVH